MTTDKRLARLEAALDGGEVGDVPDAELGHHCRDCIGENSYRRIIAWIRHCIAGGLHYSGSGECRRCGRPTLDGALEAQHAKVKAEHPFATAVKQVAAQVVGTLGPMDPKPQSESGRKSPELCPPKGRPVEVPPPPVESPPELRGNEWWRTDAAGWSMQGYMDLY